MYLRLSNTGLIVDHSIFVSSVFQWYFLKFDNNIKFHNSIFTASYNPISIITSLFSNLAPRLQNEKTKFYGFNFRRKRSFKCLTTMFSMTKFKSASHTLIYNQTTNTCSLVQVISGKRQYYWWFGKSTERIINFLTTLMKHVDRGLVPNSKIRRALKGGSRFGAWLKIVIKSKSANLMVFESN